MDFPFHCKGLEGSVVDNGDAFVRSFVWRLRQVGKREKKESKSQVYDISYGFITRPEATINHLPFRKDVFYNMALYALEIHTIIIQTREMSP